VAPTVASSIHKLFSAGAHREKNRFIG